MKLMANRIELSIRFIIICGLFNIVAVMMMTCIIYNSTIIANATNVETNDQANGSIETIPEIDPETVYVESSIPPSSTTDYYNDDLLEDVIIETTTITEPVETTLTTEPAETTIVEETEFEEKVLEYQYGRRMTPAVDIDIPTGNDMRNHTDIVDTSNYEYVGTYSITGYTPKCVHCCGNSKGITASGVPAIAGYTVAASSFFPFGTTLYIEGYGYYVVEDRGALKYNVIDIAAPSHKACYALTKQGVNVYIVHHET